MTISSPFSSFVHCSLQCICYVYSTWNVMCALIDGWRLRGPSATSAFGIRYTFKNYFLLEGYCESAFTCKVFPAN
jgi:hypothetical protein